MQAGSEGFWAILLIVVGMIIVLGFGWFFYRRVNPKKQGSLGRKNKVDKAVTAARSFARSNEYRVIAPACIQTEKSSAELDAIVVGYFGVLGVKALGYNGQVYGDEKEKTWAQITEKGGRTTFENPFIQAAADVRVIRDALLKKKIRQVPVEVVCVFTDPTVELGIPRSVEYFTVKTFKEYLKKDKFQEDCGVDLDKAEAAIRSYLKSSST